MPLEWNVQTEKERRYLHEARRLRHRLRCLSWLQGAGITHITVAQAGYVLGVTHKRVRELIDGGRIEYVETPQEWKGSRRYVAVRSLVDAPSALESGRPCIPWTWGGSGHRDGPDYDRWGAKPPRPQNAE